MKGSFHKTVVGRGLVSNSLQEREGGGRMRNGYTFPSQILRCGKSFESHELVTDLKGLVLTFTVYADCKYNLMVSVHKVCAYTSTLMRFTSRLLQQLWKTSNGGLANCPFNLLQAEEKDEEKSVAQIKHPLST